ncbi:VirK/YbjX family protein [Pasteurella testudinis]|uniref:VirK/YbjX family protein n=1 Tax=Pasteurella testudinis TaxID=761 RepID=UPI0040589B94
MFPASGKKLTKLILVRSRYYLRYILSAAVCRQFVYFLNRSPLWQKLFKENPYRFNSILYRFCDKRLRPKQRLNTLRYNFEFAEKAFGSALCQDLVQQDSIFLSALTDEISAYLNINKIDTVEGFFSINLQDQQHNRLYDLSFSFIPQQQLLISSLQGPNSDDAQDIVRRLTKQLHGIRPAYMLIVLIKILAQELNCNLLGIKHKNQAKYRWNDHSRLLFNYDDFWRENGAELNPLTQYWQLSTALERRNLDEVQSKKRSMYRKRYDMLDLLQSATAELLKQNGESDPTATSLHTVTTHS